MGTLICSIGWYYFPKYGGVYWFKGPVRTVDEPDDVTSSDHPSSEPESEDKKGKDKASDQVVLAE